MIVEIFMFHITIKTEMVKNQQISECMLKEGNNELHDINFDTINDYKR